MWIRARKIVAQWLPARAIEPPTTPPLPPAQEDARARLERKRRAIAREAEARAEAWRQAQERARREEQERYRAAGEWMEDVVLQHRVYWPGDSYYRPERSRASEWGRRIGEFIATITGRW
jgi:hypothetical protein